MAILKSDVCKKDPGILSIDFIEVEKMADMIEIEIDKTIKEKYKDGQRIEIYFGDFFEYDELTQEIKERYESSGWNVSDDGEYTITLF